MIAKVIYDDGYMVQMVRPLREYPLGVGVQVSVRQEKVPVDLVKMFNSVLSEDVKNALLEKLFEGKRGSDSEKEEVKKGKKILVADR